MRDDVQDDPFYPLALYKEFRLIQQGNDIVLSYLGIEFAACPVGRRGDVTIYSCTSHLSRIHWINLMKVFWRLGENDSCYNIKIVARPSDMGGVHMYKCQNFRLIFVARRSKNDLRANPHIHARHDTYWPSYL